MIEAKITVPKEISIKGHREANESVQLYRYLADFTSIACMQLFVWGAIIFVDVTTNNADLIWWHFLSLLVYSALMTVYVNYQSEKKLEKSIRDFSYHAKLDEIGVSMVTEKKVGWENYKYYVEYDDYIKITDINSIVSFLPKTEELSEIIDYTISKIPNKANEHGSI